MQNFKLKAAEKCNLKWQTQININTQDKKVSNKSYQQCLQGFRKGNTFSLLV